MIQFALNHMTVARLSFRDLVALSAKLGLVGIEVRNDLPQPLFDGIDPVDAGRHVRDCGLRLLAVAEVKRFNDWSSDKEAEALALMKIAKAAGAEAVSLIPRNDNLGMGNGERQAALRVALKALKPMLEDHGLVGMVEPLGFEICALRYKSEAVEGIEAVGGKGRFKLVHDTFHHTLAHGGPLFPDHAGIVHVSGVTDQTVSRHRSCQSGRFNPKITQNRTGFAETGDAVRNGWIWGTEGASLSAERSGKLRKTRRYSGPDRRSTNIKGWVAEGMGLPPNLLQINILIIFTKLRRA